MRKKPMYMADTVIVANILNMFLGLVVYFYSGRIIGESIPFLI
jgi:hypothetical protein